MGKLHLSLHPSPGGLCLRKAGLWARFAHMVSLAKQPGAFQHNGIDISAISC